MFFENLHSIKLKDDGEMKGKMMRFYHPKTIEMLLLSVVIREEGADAVTAATTYIGGVEVEHRWFRVPGLCTSCALQKMGHLTWFSKCIPLFL